MKNKKDQNTPLSGSGQAFLMPLNKFLSFAGVCSRRKAVEFIKAGLVKVNGSVVKIPERRVAEDDQVQLKNRLLVPDKKIYILLNKPRDYVTTLSDQQDRKTVIDLVRSATKKRIYPIGRLDRATTGILLLTNDGELTQKLAHPKYEVKKVYNVVLNRPLKFEDLKELHTGVTLKDGIAKVDRIHNLTGKSKTHVKVELHSGKNRIVRRIFEHFGYGVVKLDRSNYAGLTKRGVRLGQWRLLTRTEILQLKEKGFVSLEKKIEAKKRSASGRTARSRGTIRGKTGRRKK